MQKPFCLGCPSSRLETGCEKQICMQVLNWEMVTAFSLMEQGVKVGEREVEQQKGCNGDLGESHKGLRSFPFVSSQQGIWSIHSVSCWQWSI